MPGCGLNASFAHTAALPGHVAFISQSGALATALLDWAKSRNIGFSHFISMGDAADVDFGDVLDYLASDPGTRAILMYSAARAAARNKPVLLAKAGRAPEGAKAAASHTGAMAGSDIVFDAAIRRAGMLRVSTLMDLFAVAETLARARPLAGDRLAIVTNGGGAGVLAADALSFGGGKLAELSPAAMSALDRTLPATWSHGNPVDIIGDAPVNRYVETLRVLLDDPAVDSVLFMHAPSAIVPSAEIARACAPLMQTASRHVMACWLGGDGVEQVRKTFADAGIPVYDTPEQAVGAFLQVLEYKRNQQLLVQTPSSAPSEFGRDRATARRLIDGALASGRALLTEPEAKALLAAYGISVVDTRVVASVEEAMSASAAIGFPVAMKILSPQISHKSDVGGVALGLESQEAVRAAAEDMLKRVRLLRPDATISGFTVQTMVKRPRAHELIVGAACDAIFGPVVLFGQGGTAVEAISDRAVALPPLNLTLARDLVSRTRVARLLAGYRDRLPIDHDALNLVLLRVSQMICDLPEVVELDINPLLADDQGVIALDARVRVAGRNVLIRPVRPGDEAELRALICGTGIGELRLPLSRLIRELPSSELARLTQIDYEREMTFVIEGSSGILAGVHSLTDPDNIRAEFGLFVRRGVAGLELERLQLDKLIGYLRDRGTREARGEFPANNVALTELAQSLGFRSEPAAGSGRDWRRLDLRVRRGNGACT